MVKIVGGGSIINGAAATQSSSQLETDLKKKKTL